MCSSDLPAGSAGRSVTRAQNRSILEPSGALGVAAIKSYVETHKLKGKTFVAITSGCS